MPVQPMLRCVMVPGGGGRASFWGPLRAELAPLVDLDVVALDWPGVGGNPPDPAVTNYDDLAGLVARSFDRPGVLCAQSAGNYPALRVALDRPDLVTQLVLIAAAAGVDTVALGGMDWRPGLQADSPTNPAWVSAPTPDLTARLAELEMPTLLVWATHDPISPLAVGAHLARHIPRATLISYPTDDHWVAQAEAPSLAVLLAAFLNGHTTPT